MNAATNAVLNFNEKFNPDRASFSTWAHLSIQGDLRDWRRKQERRREKSIEESGLRGVPHSEDIESRVSLEQFLSTLSEEERKLWETKARAISLYGIAMTLGLSLSTVKRR